MGKRNRRERPPTSLEEIAERVLGSKELQREGFVVCRSLRAHKAYRCPHCNGIIKVGEAHLVAYPSERLDDRRHYHAGCWAKMNR